MRWPRERARFPTGAEDKNARTENASKSACFAAAALPAEYTYPQYSPAIHIASGTLTPAGPLQEFTGALTARTFMITDPCAQRKPQRPTGGQWDELLRYFTYTTYRSERTTAETSADKHQRAGHGIPTGIVYSLPRPAIRPLQMSFDPVRTLGAPRWLLASTLVILSPHTACIFQVPSSMITQIPRAQISRHPRSARRRAPCSAHAPKGARAARLRHPPPSRAGARPLDADCKAKYIRQGLTWEFATCNVDALSGIRAPPRGAPVWLPCPLASSV